MKTYDNKVVCIYHSSDVDGRSSAALVYLYHQGEDRIYFYGMNYEDFKPEKFIAMFPECKLVYIVDYSIGSANMLTLIENGIEIKWCDHHKSAIEEWEKSSATWTEENKKKVTEVLSTKMSAAVCTFRLFNPDKSKPVPEALRLISIWDTWNRTNMKEWERAEALNAALSYYKDMRWSHDSWKDLLYYNNKELLQIFIADGNSFLSYLRHITYNFNIAYAGTLEWEGIRFCVANASGNSTVFNNMVQKGYHEAVMLFRYSPKHRKWKMSLFDHAELEKPSKRILPVAVKYGGGGHEGACGFECEELPFDVHKIEPLSAIRNRGE